MHKRSLYLCFSILLLPLCLAAEEFALKDGAKISGKLVRVQNDVFEVETQYGKIKVNRSDVVSINFPENQPTAAGPSSATAAMPVEQSLQGTTYTNQTGKFKLTVPSGWKIHEQMRQETEALAGLTSADGMAGLIVEKTTFGGSLDSYKQMFQASREMNMRDYRKLEEHNVEIDARQAISLSHTARIEGEAVPFQYTIAVIPYEGEMVVITIFAPQPVFNEWRENLDKVPLSYESVNE